MIKPPYKPGPLWHRYFNEVGWYVIKIAFTIWLAVMAIIVVPVSIYLLLP